MKKQPSGYKGREKEKPNAVKEEVVEYSVGAKTVETVFECTRLEINNFRCLQDLKLESIGRVNLITGVNNVGKTTLLEALFLLIGLNNPDLASRIERWRGLPIPSDLTNATWKNLFWQFHDNATIAVAVKTETGLSRSLVVSVDPSPLSIIEEKPTEPGLEYLGIVGQRLVLDYSDEHSGVFRVIGTPTLMRRGDVMTFQLKLEPSPLRKPTTGVFITNRYTGFIDEEVQRFSNLRVKRKDGILLDALRKIEPRLEGMEILSYQGASMIHGHLTGYEELVPLPLLGDGVRRLLSILLAVAAAQGDMLLVDEIENGIHHSVMKDVWNAIAEASEVFNTQVFATTHSQECIAAAHEAFSQRSRYNFRLHRLTRLNGKVRATTYDKESLEGALSIPMEVRGWPQE